MKHIWHWLTALVFPPICRRCGKRQSIFAQRLPQPLCEECLVAWAEQLNEQCSVCGKIYSHCSCMPCALREAGCTDMVKLARYRAARCDTVAQMLLRCKDVNDRALFDFLVADLTLPTFRAMQALDADMQDAVVTYAPRRGQAVRAIGHDQAKQLAGVLARRLDISCQRLIRRIGRTEQQKDLNAEQRLQNAKHSFALRRAIDLQGKTVLLVDDVCTTGATLAACTRLLTSGGAARVIAVCVAWSPNTEKAE